VAAGAIDPRLRARRISVRRDEGRRRLRRLAVLGGALAVLLVGLAAVRSPLLDVDRIEVVGANHTPVDAVRTASGVRRHAAMTDVDLSRARTGVAALPWVRSVGVTRHWPGTVRVTVTERTPVGTIAAAQGGYMLIDGDGRVLEPVAEPPPGLAVLDGVGTAGAPGTTLDASAGDALTVLKALPPSLAAQTAAVVISPSGPTVQLVARGEIRLGSIDDLGAKLVAAQTVLDQVDLERLCAVDVRVPAAPTLTRGKACA
jgi:cell division protein FtsQ